MSKVFANLSSEIKILGMRRKIALYVNKPTPADAFVPWNDKLNLKLRVQISADEKKHSRPSLRIRRKLSAIFTQNTPVPPLRENITLKQFSTATTTKLAKKCTTALQRNYFPSKF